MAKDKLHNFRSDEEWYFSWYVEELVKHGFLKKAEYEPETWDIFDSVNLPWLEQQKTKTKNRTSHAISDSDYTPDWELQWSSEADGVFVYLDKPRIKTAPPFFPKKGMFSIRDYPTSFIDVKGAGGFGHKNASLYTFPYKQRLMWLRHRIYVQKIVPQKLFAKTFTPMRYLFTDEGKQRRKIKWKVVTLQEYVDKYTIDKKDTSSDSPQMGFFD